LFHSLFFCQPLPFLLPAEHYVPVGYNAPDDVLDVVRWLRANDGLARAIAERGRRFALDHLGREGRLCYIKVLLEEMAKLQRFQVDGAAAAAAGTPFEHELAKYGMKPRPEGR
jgi:hypothetical protein